MMKPSGRDPLNLQIYAAASDWFVEFRTGDVDSATRRKFNDWLRTSPEHMRAYLELGAIWNEGSRLDPNRRFGAEELGAVVPTDANVIPLDLNAQTMRSGRRSLPDPAEVEAAFQSALAQGDGRTRDTTSLKSWLHLRVLAIAASLALMGVGTWVYYGERNTYSTGIGEQRSLVLEDGSTVELNAHSRMRVRFTADRRGIELLEGQALFHVAKDKTRPFIVESGDARVRAVGTEFDVYRRKTGTTVTVLEGRVAVAGSAMPVAGQASVVEPVSVGEKRPAVTRAWRSRPAASRLQRRESGARAEGDANANANANAGVRSGGGVDSFAGIGEFVLAAGEQATLTARTTVKPLQPNIAAATAWTQRRLVFESATLGEVAEEFNRYNARRLVIQSPGIYEFHITGVFSSTDPESLIRFLQSRHGIVVTEEAGEILVTRKSR